MRTLLPSRSHRLPNFASQMRTAFSRMASNTGFSSPGDELITRSTSEVAVCCSNDSRKIGRALAQLIEQPRILDGDDGLCGEVLHQLDLLISEGQYLLTINRDSPNQLPLF